MITNQSLIDRFIRYVKIDTQSSETTGTCPSTAKQHDLAALLFDELKALGLNDVVYDREHCLVYAFLPASPGAEALPAIGFVAHMDTSDAASGTDVKPRFIMSYDGNDPLLPLGAFPSLKDHLGEDLIAADGTTLLGADDKAGVAEIMNLIEFYVTHPEAKHRAVAIAFTPDEEIGHGVDFFDPAFFKAKAAYTVDGGGFGEIEDETFNAAAAFVTVHGLSVHPGTAKGIMKNACLIAMAFNAALPEGERPECTEKREGFYMLLEMKGDVEEASLHYIIRDHDREIFEKRKAAVRGIAAALNEQYGDGTVDLVIVDQYYNMAEILKDHPELVRAAEKAVSSLGGTPVCKPIRGGTDGSKLSFMGIPCPNLGVGGYNFHGRFEYVCVREMELCAETLILLAGA